MIPGRSGTGPIAISDRRDLLTIAKQLGDRDLHVWRIGLTANDARYGDMLAILSLEERARAARFRFDADRRRFVAARASVREIVGAYIALPAAEVEFVYGAYGKPSVEQAADGNEGIHFNVSHAQDLALCAVTRAGEVGVDVESIRDDLDLDGIAALFFSVAERQLLSDSSDTANAFARIWVRKEACVKASGVGIGGDLTGFSVGLAESSHVPDADGVRGGGWTVRELAVGEGFAAAVATRSSLSLTLLGFC